MLKALSNMWRGAWSGWHEKQCTHSAEAIRAEKIARGLHGPTPDARGFPGGVAIYIGDREGHRGLHGECVQVLWTTATRAQVYWPSRGKATNVKLLNLKPV